MERLQLHEAVPLALDRVLVDLAESGRDRTERRFDALGQTRFDLLQALGHALPREINIHTVLEDDRDHREAELRDRTHLFGAGQAHHGALDGEGN